MEIEITNLALESLADIAEYVRLNFSDKVARKSVEGIVAAVNRLLVFPNSGMPIPELASHGNVRCMTHRQNRIYYRVLPEKIQILIVWDGRKDPEKLLDLMLDFFSAAMKKRQ